MHTTSSRPPRLAPPRPALSSIEFAHRMYFFLNAYARGSKYVTEIRRRDAVSGLVTPAPLIEAVAIEASWAGVHLPLFDPLCACVWLSV